MTPAPHEVPYLASTRELVAREEDGNRGSGIRLALVLILPVWGIVAVVIYMWFVE